MCAKLNLGCMPSVLDDARAHAEMKIIDWVDVKLAVSMQMEQLFTTPTLEK